MYIPRKTGKPTELTGNDLISLTYDHKRRPETITVAGNSGSKTFSYSEDSTKHTVTATNENGGVVKVESAKNGSYEKLYYNNALQVQTNYDAEGKVTSVTDSLSGETAAYGYNSLGQPASYYREKSGSATNLYESYSYNKYGDLSGKSLAYGVSQSYSYGYSADSRRYCNSISFGNVTVQLDMDSYNRPTQKRVLTGGTQLVRKEYSYLETNNKRTDRLTEIKGYVKGVLKQREQYGYDSTSAALKTITYPLKNKQITYSYYTTTG